MSLKITKNEKIFEVEGPINGSTASFFKTHFVITLNSLSELTIDVDNVTEIDQSGMKAFRSIFDMALLWNKPLVLVGERRKEIYAGLEHNLVA